MRTVWVALLYLLLTSAAVAADCSDHVVWAMDGDTIEGLHHPHPKRIRLNGIDCPEKSQAFGKHSMHTASDPAFGVEVTLQTHGHDKYKRTIAEVLRPMG